MENFDEPSGNLIVMSGWLVKCVSSIGGGLWNVWEALRMFSVSTEIEQERQTEDKVIMYNIIILSILY